MRFVDPHSEICNPFSSQALNSAPYSWQHHIRHAGTGNNTSNPLEESSEEGVAAAGEGVEDHMGNRGGIEEQGIVLLCQGFKLFDFLSEFGISFL